VPPGNAPLVAIALASAIVVAAAPKVSQDLVTAMMRDQRAAACAKEAGKTAQAYVTRAFELRNVTLHGGKRMTGAIATDGCMLLGQSARIMIFERTAGGYRRVLDSVTIPDVVDVSEDGTAVLPTHETIDTIFEAAYVWNGRTYAFSGQRSHIYDVPLGERRPYEVLVRFAPGAFATTLSGSVALNFGERYVVEARAGQRMTIELTKHTGRRPAIFLSYGERNLAQIDKNGWSGELPQTGTYALTVFGSGEPDATLVSTYAIRLTIH